MSAALNGLLLQWNRCAASTMSDGELLCSYLQDRAEAAFRLLVERHGAMVLGVCRHRLGDQHTAEDAFQATFLLLARRAGSIRRPESLAAWLHRTAIRIYDRIPMMSLAACGVAASDSNPHLHQSPARGASPATAGNALDRQPHKREVVCHVPHDFGCVARP